MKRFTALVLDRLRVVGLSGAGVGTVVVVRPPDVGGCTDGAGTTSGWICTTSSLEGTNPNSFGSGVVDSDGDSEILRHVELRLP